MAVMFNSNYEETIPFSDVCAQINLGIGVVETYTVPGTATNKYTMLLSYTYNSNVFVRLNAAPAVPGAGLVTQEPYNEFRPGSDGTKRYVQGGDVVQLITPDASAYVGIRLMSLPS